jgi:hypothetical protein
MDLDELVTSKSEYLKKEDVGEAGVNLTIKAFKKVRLKGDGGEEEKIVMMFEEDYKPMVLNLTNKNRLKAATGAKTTDDVKGKVINVYNDPMVDFGGEIVGGLRIRKSTAPPPPPAQADPGFNDDVPF